MSQWWDLHVTAQFLCSVKFQSFSVKGLQLLL